MYSYIGTYKYIIFFLINLYTQDKTDSSGIQIKFICIIHVCNVHASTFTHKSQSRFLYNTYVIRLVME